MNIYFVRHGESTLNAQHIHQPSDASLSEKGQAQALYVAKRLEPLPIDTIYSSPFTRAIQTARIIGSLLKKPIVEEPLLRELKRPTEIEGKPIDDPTIQKLKQNIIDHSHDPHWHYADEENMYDLQNRCLNVLQLFEKIDQNNIVVVTHGITLRMIIACMMFPHNTVVSLFDSFLRFMHTTNTGITVVERKEDKTFRLLTWNDYAHTTAIGS